MRIAIDAVGLRSGGGARVLESTLDALCRIRPGWRFTVFASPPGRQQIAFPAHPNLIVEHVRERGIVDRLRWLTRGLGAAVALNGDDALLAMANLPPLRCGVPITLYLHQMKLLDDGVAPTPRIRLLRAYFRLSAKRAASVVVQTRAMAELLARRVSALAGRIATIPSAVDVMPHDEASLALRDRLAALAAPRLCYVSSASTHKNNARLLDAFATSRTARAGGTLILTIDRAEGEAARQAVAQGRIVLLGSVRPSEVRAIYEASDLMVFPSLVESFGLPIAEAMTFGCPVIASDRGFARELLGEDGAFFDPEDTAAMRDMIDAVATDPARLAALAAAGIARADMFAPHHYGERLVEVIERDQGRAAA